MNNKLLTVIMSILLLISVYIVMCVYLPGQSENNGGSAAGVPGNAENGVKGWNLWNAGNAGDDKAADNGNNSNEPENFDFTGNVVVIDSGHGGIDPGKTSADGILEKEVNLAIAYKLKAYLEKAGMKVVMTRTDDSGLYSESDVNKKSADMKKRCDIIREANADVVVSIHQNSFQSASVKGAQVFYYKHSAKGKQLAQSMQQAFRDYLDESNKRVEKADNTYYMLVHTPAPTVIAECGFLSNPEEAKLLTDEQYQDKVAMAIYYGIIDYFVKG